MNKEPMVQCLDCGWIGKLSECVHTSLRSVENCPKCGGKNLWELDDRKDKIPVPDNK